MLKATALLVPLDVWTVTLAAPGVALDEMLNDVTICVELLTVQAPGVTPAFATLTVQGETKLVPVKVTGLTVVPRLPPAGLMALSVGVKSTTVRDRFLLPCAPAESVIVTVTVKVPATVGVPLIVQQPVWAATPEGRPVAVNPTYCPVPPEAEMLAK